MFKRWICHPLRSIEKINERLDAIEALDFLGLEQGILSANNDCR